MAKANLATRKAERLEKAAKRREAAGEVMDARMRTGIGFAGTYIATQVLPAIAPSVAEYQGTIDLGVAIVGGYLALTDEDELGDYALGMALVGSTQTLDNIGTAIQDWFAR